MTLDAVVLVLVDDDTAARDDRVDVAVDLEALPRRMVHVHVVRLVQADHVRPEGS